MKQILQLTFFLNVLLAAQENNTKVPNAEIEEVIIKKSDYQFIDLNNSMKKIMPKWKAIELVPAYTPIALINHRLGRIDGDPINEKYLKDIQSSYTHRVFYSINIKAIKYIINKL